MINNSRALLLFILSISFLFLSACNNNENAHKEPSPPTITDPAVKTVRQYIQSIYKDRLNITDSQIEQLAWVIENPQATPEMESKGFIETIHREIPRSLARLYSLQLLRRGSAEDYQTFIAPQSSNILSNTSFAILSDMVQKLDKESYEILEAAAIISAVTLSPKAIEKAASIIKEPLSTDSVQFLSQTAPYADKIYPLAKEVIEKYRSSTAKFETVFMPNSHLRHMMYNEGSLSMYSHISNGIAHAQIDREKLNLWYCHWTANIAGFRGHLAPEGSLYLDQNTFMAMNRLKAILDDMLQGVSVNPMQAYLKSRAEWLGLNTLTNNPKELIALGSLGASLRLFTTEQGSALYKGFSNLNNENQQRWHSHTEQQLKVQAYPAETYGPAVFANAIETAGLAESIRKVLPVYMDVLDEEMRMRKNNEIRPTVPVSFRELARQENVNLILKPQQPITISINPTTGLAAFKKSNL